MIELVFFAILFVKIFKCYFEIKKENIFPFYLLLFLFTFVGCCLKISFNAFSNSFGNFGFFLIFALTYFNYKIYYNYLKKILCNHFTK